jgi:hypothetical protein
VLAIVNRAPLSYAAISTKGELVRGRFDGSDFVRAHVAADPDAFLAADSLGRVVIAAGKRLSMWDTDISEIASFETPIAAIEIVPSGLVITLENRDVLFLANERGAIPVKIPMEIAQPTLVTGDSRLAYTGVGLQMRFVELPSLARWSLPKVYSASPRFTESPSGGRLGQSSGGSYMVWTLPRPGADFAAWLDELTNGLEGTDGQISWPWQAPKVAPHGS